MLYTSLRAGAYQTGLSNLLKIVQQPTQLDRPRRTEQEEDKCISCLNCRRVIDELGSERTS